MRDRIWFFALTTLTALVLPPIVGGAAATIAHLAGMAGATLLMVFGSALVATFGAVTALAGLAAVLFFAGPQSSSGGGR